jgi:hypothetical protein
MSVTVVTYVCYGKYTGAQLRVLILIHIHTYMYMSKRNRRTRYSAVYSPLRVSVISNGTNMKTPFCLFKILNGSEPRLRALTRSGSYARVFFFVFPDKKILMLLPISHGSMHVFQHKATFASTYKYVCKCVCAYLHMYVHVSSFFFSVYLRTW